MRLKIIRFIIVILFVVIVLGLIYVQAVQGRYYYQLSVNNRIRVVPLHGWRGRIMDRNGEVLADNRISYNVMITPQELDHVKELFDFLGGVLNVKSDQLMDRYRRKKYAPFAPVMVAEDISKEQAMVLEENKFLFPGLMIQEGFQRYYPLRKNSAHVLGYVGMVNRSELEKIREYGYSEQSLMGRTGVEEYYDEHLRGKDGGLQIEVNSRSQQVRLMSIREPQKGEDIALTIDRRLQQTAMELLEERIGVITVMDIDNGEILSLTSSPSFDPNVPNFSAPSSPFLNRAIKGVYPPGSVFKVPVAVAGLDTNKITARASFFCEGFYELGGIRFGCTHHHGQQDMIEALAHSCNVYFYHLGLILGESVLGRYARLLGLGRLTEVDLPYEKPGFIPGRKQRLLAGGHQWYTGDTLNLSIGQGDVLATPLQLVKMMATVARQGRIVHPHVLWVDRDHPQNKFLRQYQLNIRPEVFETVQKGLRATVTNASGTAHVLDIPGLYVAGKTGTAQTSGGRDHHAWFVGYALGEKKQVAVCVFLEHGGSSLNACMIAKELFLRMQEMEML